MTNDKSCQENSSPGSITYIGKDSDTKQGEHGPYAIFHVEEINEFVTIKFNYWKDDLTLFTKENSVMFALLKDVYGKPRGFRDRFGRRALPDEIPSQYRREAKIREKSLSNKVTGIRGKDKR